VGRAGRGAAGVGRAPTRPELTEPGGGASSGGAVAGWAQPTPEPAGPGGGTGSEARRRP
jgi:hypothetical protein